MKQFLENNLSACLCKLWPFVKGK